MLEYIKNKKLLLQVVNFKFLFIQTTGIIFLSLFSYLLSILTVLQHIIYIRNSTKSCSIISQKLLESFKKSELKN